ncbi:FecR domain-containing protein [Pandoraea pnomenusa]|uniref:FecR domain-containing protein n=1 Tax=Pandoraea pnomenusa TaxID=93220 RepID=UPI003341B31D
MRRKKDKTGGRAAGVVRVVPGAQVAHVALGLAAAALGSLLPCGAAYAQPSGAQANDFLYRVQHGDTLIGLADRYMDGIDGWRVLQRQNRVPDPKHLQPGTTIRIPFARIPVMPARVQVVAVQGDVRSNGAPVKAGDAVPEGAHIETYAQSSATLALSDGTRVTLPPDTEADVRRARVFTKSSLTDTVIKLRRGDAQTHVAPRGTGVGRFEISTPTMVTGVRGTRFRVSAGTQTSLSEVLQGEVQVRGDRGDQHRSIIAGQGVKVSQTGAVSRPVALPGAPALVPLAGEVVGSRATVTWAPVKRAVRYRVVVARDAEVTEWVSIQYADATSAGLTGLPEGHLTVAVTAVDADGFAGAEGVMPMTVRLHPEAPYMLTPSVGARQYGESTSFEWAQVEDADQYEWQLAREGQFDAGAADVHTRATTLRQDVAVGPWQWRLRSVLANGTVGPWSAAVAFEVRPPGPVPDVVDDGDDTLQLRWDGDAPVAGRPAVTYHVQMARDAGFAAPVLDVSSETPSIRFARPDAGEYFVRVARVDDAMAGASEANRLAAFSKPQRIRVANYVRDTKGQSIGTEEGRLERGQ